MSGVVRFHIAGSSNRRRRLGSTTICSRLNYEDMRFWSPEPSELAMNATNRHKLRESIGQSELSTTVSSDDVSRLAIELSSRFPQSGLTIDAIEDELRVASRAKSEKEVNGEVMG